MKLIRVFCAALALLAIAAMPTPSPGSADMLQRMQSLYPHLNSLEATVHVDITLHTFPYLSPSLDGTYYHKEPSKDKIAFHTVPVIAKQFDKVYPHVESPSRWESVYHVTNEGDDGTQTTFKLVPRIRGRIDHITAKVDDKNATVDSMVWQYNDGGYARLNQSFTVVDGNFVPKTQNGHVEVPNYTADLTSSFSNYKLNPSIPDSVFKQ
ncbi:MAG: hypothetical protein JO024_08415 [Candidatus Eremiobacteraeota bacterium]|nr:hypothetical protein [Candidatus Eremiobacteraeota bacterium]